MCTCETCACVMRCKDVRDMWLMLGQRWSVGSRGLGCLWLGLTRWWISGLSTGQLWKWLARRLAISHMHSGSCRRFGCLWWGPRPRWISGTPTGSLRRSLAWKLYKFKKWNTNMRICKRYQNICELPYLNHLKPLRVAFSESPVQL